MCSVCKGRVHDQFIKGMAAILWASAWADHAEEHGCHSLSGQKIEEIMPRTPEHAYTMAERLAGAVEQANGVNLPALFAYALVCDGRSRDSIEHVDYWSPLAERFGECLAYQAAGSGVSWEDDHAPALINGIGDAPPRAMVVPHVEAFELQVHAEETCKACKAARRGRKATVRS